MFSLEMLGDRRFVKTVTVVLVLTGIAFPKEYFFLSGCIATPALMLIWYLWVSDLATGIRMLHSIGGFTIPTELINDEPPPRRTPRKPIRITDPVIQ